MVVQNHPAWDGINQGLRYSQGDPVQVSWLLRGAREESTDERAQQDKPLSDRPLALAVGALIGHKLVIECRAEIECQHCGTLSSKSYGAGFCYPCFVSLARCDLCMMAPTRCHFAAGTCREPEWAQTFCFSEHLVYLAYSSGHKVGITRAGQAFQRWANQGAVAGVVLARTQTRQLAGLVEAQLTEQISDRSNWRKLLSELPQSIDLLPQIPEMWRLREAQFGPLPTGVTVLESEQRTQVSLRYPSIGLAPARQLKLIANRPQMLTLLGVRGQYLLGLEGGLKLSKYRGHSLRVNDLGAMDHAQLSKLIDANPTSGDSQLELFS